MNNEPEPSEAAELMADHGIRQSLVAQYLYKEYRYSSLRDAVAQARRDKAADLSDM